MSNLEGQPNTDEIVQITGKIVRAYVTNNRVDRHRIGDLIDSVRQSLAQLAGGSSGGASPESLQPATIIKRSITPDYLICLEDGARLKMMKRHLRTHYGLTPPAILGKMGSASGLSDGGPQLCHAPERTRPPDRVGWGINRARPQKGRIGRPPSAPDRHRAHAGPMVTRGAARSTMPL